MFITLSSVIKKIHLHNPLYQPVRNLITIQEIQTTLSHIFPTTNITVVAYRNNTVTLKTKNHLAAREVMLQAERVKQQLTANKIPARKIVCVG